MITGGLISQVNPLAANSVTARVGALTHPEQDKSDDSAMYFLRWKNGMVATLSMCAWRGGATEYGGEYFSKTGWRNFEFPTAVKVMTPECGLQIQSQVHGHLSQFLKQTLSRTNFRLLTSHLNTAMKIRRSHSSTACAY